MRRIAIALGDPNGIGPEIVLKALAELAAHGDFAATVFGPAEVLERTAHGLGLMSLYTRLNVHDIGGLSAAAAQPGLVHAEAGASAIAAAQAAIHSVQRGECDAVVAAPHNETAIHRAGIAFSGYPSLVARVCGQPADSVFLLLVGAGLRIVHVTLHESVASALARITPDLIVSATRSGVRACQWLGTPKPKVGVFGINPHASEGGLFGTEDARNTEPAVATLRAAGFEVQGPTGADVLLSQRQCELYVAMLHDQGHIPVKLLAPQAASAISIGAQVMLASTGHGSAMEIAGKGVALPRALLRSLRLMAGLSEAAISP